MKCALDFLDRVPDEARANEVIERLRPHLEADGSIPVTGGAENERLTALTLSEQPGSRSRALFTDEQMEADLDQLDATVTTGCDRSASMTLHTSTARARPASAPTLAPASAADAVDGLVTT